MGKNNDIQQLINLLAKSLCHRIGSMVNNTQVYAKKYYSEAKNIFENAKEVKLRHNWNNYDKIKIKNELKKKLKAELERKDFLDNRKFDLMDEEINKALSSLDLFV
ncbi:MAG TPA: hypothetical protein VJK07_04260 [Candidatus Nanoarchaeia archaeon]|nr:hypothetical protein [Candidatus Nanoarchaeia archaeon]